MVFPGFLWNACHENYEPQHYGFTVTGKRSKDRDIKDLCEECRKDFGQTYVLAL